MFVLRWTFVSLKDLKMDPRSLSLVVISVGFVVFVNFALTNPIIDSSESSSEIAKVFLDCKHSDYRTYIQCLKRQKRQQHGPFHIDHSCLESCMKDCNKEGRACNETCLHCMRKKTKHHIINITETEYEIECTTGNCTTIDKNGSKKEPIIVNVTNHIHIHNHYNKTDTILTNPPRQPCPCYYIIWRPCYCRPQYPICQYQQQWPCTPYGQYDGGFSGGYSQVGVGMIGMAPVLSATNDCCATCTCSNPNVTCDECNPPAG